jgi:hypothetical protein
VFATRKGERSEKAEDLRGILNSGHSRGWPYIRWDMATRRREACPTFAMAVLGGIGDFPDTIEDRAVILPMRRRAPGEQVQQYRFKRVVPELHAYRDRLAAWVCGQVDQLALAEPELPVEDRAADTWEPLVAIADAAGGDWPDRARNACMVMTGAVEPDDATAGERLLADLRIIFERDPANPEKVVQFLDSSEHAAQKDVGPQHRAVGRDVHVRSEDGYAVEARRLGDRLVEGRATGPAVSAPPEVRPRALGGRRAGHRSRPARRRHWSGSFDGPSHLRHNGR